MNKLLNYLLVNLKLSTSLVPESRLVLGVSGGQDSISLLILLLAFQNQWQFYIITIYCNHLWQQNSVDVILHLAKTYYVTHIEFIVPTTIYNLKNENKSRIWRYNLFNRVAFFTSTQYILLGHTNSDKVETFLFNIIRGSGVTGLHSIPAERLNYSPKLLCFSTNIRKPKILFSQFKLQKGQNLWTTEQLTPKYKENIQVSLLRPLLLLNRYEIQKLLTWAYLPIWTDKTNFELHYRRNRIRFELLPTLRFYYNPNVDLCILHCIETIEQEMNYLTLLTIKTLKFYNIYTAKKNFMTCNIEFFRNCPYILKKRLLIESLHLIKYFDIHFQVIQNLLKILLLADAKETFKIQIFLISKRLILIYYSNYFIIYSQKL